MTKLISGESVFDGCELGSTIKVLAYDHRRLPRELYFDFNNFQALSSRDEHFAWPTRSFHSGATAGQRPYSLFPFKFIKWRMAFPKRLVPISLLYLLAGAVAISVAWWTLDAPVDAALNAAKDPALQRFAWWCSKLGEGWVPAVAGIFLAVVFVRIRCPAVAAKIFFVMLTCEITGLAALILRILIGRARPLANVPQGIYGVWYHGQWIIGKYQFSSFPSGHSATAVGLAAAAWLIDRRWGAIATVYALLVMWSRIALQCHHLSDVIASAVLSIPLAILCKRLLLPTIEWQFGRLASQGDALKSDSLKR
jgi:membrane-associated phospholipid phosphatase